MIFFFASCLVLLWGRFSFFRASGCHHSIWDESSLTLNVCPSAYSALLNRFLSSVLFGYLAHHLIFQGRSPLKLPWKHGTILHLRSVSFADTAMLLFQWWMSFFTVFHAGTFWKATTFHLGCFPFDAPVILLSTLKFHLQCLVLPGKYTQPIPQWLEANTERSQQTWSTWLMVPTIKWESAEAKMESQLS